MTADIGTPALGSEFRNSDESSEAVPLLKDVFPVNHQMLQWLTAFAERGEVGPENAGLVKLGRLLKQATAASREKLAQLHFLLLDAHFRDPQRWRQALLDLSSESAPLPAPIGSVNDLQIRMARSAFLLAWTIARRGPQAADLIMGATTDCARIIASCSLPQLELLAERHFAWVRPRWEDRPENWQRLIKLSLQPSGSQQSSLDGQGLLMFLGDLVAG